MSEIVKILAREVLDSRGNPTVQAEVLTRTGASGSAMVPSGASTGSHEALELRDEDSKRYLGRGVLKAVANISNKISPHLTGMDVQDQAAVDQAMIELDGTPNKAVLGANAILAVSLATARAAANEKGVPLYEYWHDDNIPLIMPVPMMNIINGGVHADNNIDIQEFMILPVGAPSFAEAVRYGAEVFHSLKTLLLSRSLTTAVGDEGGFVPNMTSNEASIEAILEALHQAGFKAGEDIFLGLDVAGSELYEHGRYKLASENRSLDVEAFINILQSWLDQYPLITIEDPMAEDDWDGWRLLTETLGDRVQLVGDDLFVTNTEIFKRGIADNIANSILIKVNQIGSLTEAMTTVHMAREAGYNIIVSHRSGDTEDTSIADLAVATCAGQIKAGSLSRSERVAKYNRLINIEEQLDGIKYAGKQVFNHFKG